jgi:hypothetical protein
MRPSRASIVRAVPATLLTLMSVGCGGGTGSVEGRLTVAGKEVTTGALITFIGPTGEKVQALVKSDGTFFAENVPAGTVEVTVENAPLPPKQPSGSKPDRKGPPETAKPKHEPPKPGNQVPDRYGEPENGLTCTINAGQRNVVQLELSP